MVGRETEFFDVMYESFKEAWSQEDAPRAWNAFQWLREALIKHMRWEEESLFEELELRCSESELRRVRAHHLRHEALESLLERIGKLLDEYVECCDGSGGALGQALCELDTLLREHRVIEISQVCYPLDQVLEEHMVTEIEMELCERGRA